MAEESTTTTTTRNYYTTVEAARALRVSLKHIGELVRLGRMKARKAADGRWQIPETALTDYRAVRKQRLQRRAA